MKSDRMLHRERSSIKTVPSVLFLSLRPVVLANDSMHLLFSCYSTNAFTTCFFCAAPMPTALRRWGVTSAGFRRPPSCTENEAT